jgi:hypothetical protein
VGFRFRIWAVNATQRRPWRFSLLPAVLVGLAVWLARDAEGQGAAFVWGAIVAGAFLLFTRFWLVPRLARNLDAEQKL